METKYFARGSAVWQAVREKNMYRYDSATAAVDVGAAVAGISIYFAMPVVFLLGILLL